MSYLVETHFHTEDISPCGDVKIIEGLEAYKQAGYSAVMISDHISTGYLNRYPGETYKEKIDFFLSAYRIGKEKCEDENFKVLLGMELRFDEEADNDYLVIGVDESFFYENEWFTKWTQKEFKEYCDRHSMLLIQAHPFRKGMKVIQKRYLHGIEVFNGNVRHDSANDIATLWAKKYELLTTSGSDFHEWEDLARGGMYFETQICSSQQLRTEIMAGRYTLKTLI